jgi:cardiolipin synthase
VDIQAIIPVALDWTLRFGLVAHVIWRRRPVATSLAWIAVTLAVPIFGLILYVLIGETRLGQKRVQRLRHLVADLLKPVRARWAEQNLDWDGSASSFGLIAAYGSASSGIPPLRGNTVELIEDTDRFLHALIDAIDNAREHVHIQTFIWMPTGDPRAVAEACIRAANRDVTVRVLVDAVGARPFLKSDLPDRMRAAGVKFAVALRVGLFRALLLRRLDVRNHRKIVVIDGKVAFAGSQNMTDRTFKVSRRHGIGPWVDASVRVDGPAAQALQLVFLHDWQQECDDEDRARLHLDQLVPRLHPPAHDEAVVQLIPSGPGEAPEATEQAFLMAIYAAREELVLTTPYFAPSESIDGALRAAAARGVKVSLVLPKRSDAFLAAAAGRGHFPGLLDAGVRIMLFRDGLLHAKTMTVDRHVAMVGSANIDMRSFRINFEVNLFIDDPMFAARLRRLQQSYIGASDTVGREAWHRRPTRKRLIDNAASLLSPLL